MHRGWPALALLACSMANGQAPSYSAAGIVNTPDYSAGPFAANSVVSIFGTNLADGTAVSTSTAVVPTDKGLGGVGVYVANMPAPMLYTSPNQINFLIPSNLTTGSVPVRVVKQGLTGPSVYITLVTGAPALFPYGNYVIAVHGANQAALLSADSPGAPGEVVVVYATGLGPVGEMIPGEIPSRPGEINNLAALKVYLAGSPVDTSLIRYAGVTPGCAGLYQINLILPQKLPADPEIRVAVGSQMSLAGMKLPVRGSS